MNLKEYADKAKRTLAELGNDFADELHMVIGMVTESAELIDVYKKHLAYSKKMDYVNMQEEIGDLMWYLINFCTLMGWDLENILEANIHKLETRYPEKFTEQDANVRDLGKERTTLEDKLL